MKYIVVNKGEMYQYYPYQCKDDDRKWVRDRRTTFTSVLDNAREFDTKEEAEEECKWLYENLVRTKGHPDILKVVEKNILQRKDKLKKIANES
jgi:hypothetical protein